MGHRVIIWSMYARYGDQIKVIIISVSLICKFFVGYLQTFLLKLFIKYITNCACLHILSLVGDVSFYNNKSPNHIYQLQYSTGKL